MLQEMKYVVGLPERPRNSTDVRNDTETQKLKNQLTEAAMLLQVLRAHRG